jgi:NitT/TauT family transport system permease protein
MGSGQVELVNVAVTELDVRTIPIAGRDNDGVVAPPAPPPVARRSSPLRWLGGAVSRWWTVLGVVAAWQLWLGFTGFNSIVLPRPTDVVSDVVGHPGAYAGDTVRTIGLAVVGVAVGTTLGFAIAVMTWASSLAAGAIGPLVLMLRSIPIVAVIPVVARVVGYGDKIVPVVTIMLAFFPAYVMTTSGLRAASSTTVDLMRALGASRWMLLRRVLVPSALPNLLVAVRLCASSAVLAAMVAEFLAGTSGLGRLFSNSRVRFDNERAWGAAVIATALSVAFFQIALRLERWGRSRFR